MDAKDHESPALLTDIFLFSLGTKKKSQWNFEFHNPTCLVLLSSEGHAVIFFNDRFDWQLSSCQCLRTRGTEVQPGTHCVTRLDTSFCLLTFTRVLLHNAFFPPFQQPIFNSTSRKSNSPLASQLWFDAKHMSWNDASECIVCFFDSTMWRHRSHGVRVWSLWIDGSGGSSWKHCARCRQQSAVCGTNSS